MLNMKFMWLVIMLSGNLIGSITTLFAFTSTPSLVHRKKCYRRSGVLCFSGDGDSDIVHAALSNSANEESVQVKDLLGDLPTPTLLIELSLAEKALNNTSMSLNDFLQNQGRNNYNTTKSSDATSLDAHNVAALDGSIFVHTQVTNTSARDRINRDLGSGKSPVIGRIDTSSRQHVPGGAFLSIGLSNHHVGGYYWARGMGIGASLEAHGVAFRGAEVSSSDSAAATSDGELYWKRRGTDPESDVGDAVARGATTDESSNSNDGKRSEWADFLVSGDTVQLLPHNATKVLFESSFRRLVGVRRAGRPLGADPIVERLWKRGPSVKEAGGTSPNSWIPL